VTPVGRAAPKAGETRRSSARGTLGLAGTSGVRARGRACARREPHHRRLELATELGAEAIHALADGPLDAAARRVSGREGVDLVVETRRRGGASARPSSW